VFFDDLNITHTKGKVLQEDHYYPFGLNISALSSTAPLSKPNRYKFNGGVEFNTDFSLNWYETTHRGLDVTLGRFMQIDPMADILSSVTPYNFGYNNPIMFNDPSGLMGQGCPTGDCDEDYYNDGEVRDLGEVVVTASKPKGGNNSSLHFDDFLNDLKWSDNSVKRGLWAQYNQNGVQGLSNVLSQPKSLHFSQAEYLFSKNNQYMKDLGKLYAYGVSGTMLAVVAGPLLIEEILPAAIEGSAIGARGVSTGLKVGYNSLKVGYNGLLASANNLTANIYHSTLYLNQVASYGVRNTTSFIAERSLPYLLSPLVGDRVFDVGLKFHRTLERVSRSFNIDFYKLGKDLYKVYKWSKPFSEIID
jgi:RHS repeat-associated protein